MSEEERAYMTDYRAARDVRFTDSTSSRGRAYEYRRELTKTKELGSTVIPKRWNDGVRSSFEKNSTLSSVSAPDDMRKLPAKRSSTVNVRFVTKDEGEGALLLSILPTTATPVPIIIVRRWHR